MQMLTDMEHQVQQSGECSEQFNADSISTQDVKTVTNLQPNNEEANRNADLHDENCSPNTSEKRTIHEQPGYQTKKQATSSKKFDSFEVNWTKLSDNLLSRLNSLQNRRLQHPGTAIPRELRLKKHEMASLVNTLVDQLRAIDTTIRADIMESVSKQVLLKYPCLEILDDDGFGDGLSHKSLKQKLVERNSYLNRLSRATGEKLPANQKHRNRRAGTIQEYWKTTTDQCSKEIFSKLRRDEPSLLTEGFLNESQAFVRSRLDQNKDLKLILSELPVLRRQQLLNFHFKQATGIDIGTLRTYFTSKRAKIVDYSTSQKAFKLQSTSSDYEVFDFLAKSVGEDLSDLVLKKEIGTGIDDVREESAGPVIICIDIGNGSYLYYVFANHARVTEGATDIVGALQDLMCVQYVHSFMYMKPVAKFLELVQEYFLKIFPTKGSKSSATRIGKQQRLVKKVIASLSNHGLPLDEMVSSTVIKCILKRKNTAKPTAIISPTTKRKHSEEDPQPEPLQQQREQSPLPLEAPPEEPRSPLKTPSKQSKVGTEGRIKQEIKQLSPIVPSAAAAIEENRLVKKLEEDQQASREEQLAEEEEEGLEGELIVPDVIAPGTYDKDSSPAGSDSGIENEGTDLSKIASQEEEESELTLNETVKHIPGEISVSEGDEGQEELVVNGNTQVVVLEEIVIQGAAQVKLIKCAQCVMCFRNELWYKKHLMNYHGIDLSNIAHFLSNLQTLDEGIQDGDGGATEQDFEAFQMQEEGEAPGGNNDATDKTEDGGESSKRKSEEYAMESVKRVRELDGSSTPSPATLQMYPEIKLSTSNGKLKAGRRRKEKLVLINSDADMRIKHEYGPAAAHSEESTSSSSQSSQPLMNNMFVVRYLEQAAMMAGSSGMVDSPGINKENGKYSPMKDPLSIDELDDGMTPFERSKIVEINNDDKPTFTCSICETAFEDRQTIQDHVNIVHKDVKRRSCPHCGRTFTQTGDLTRHVRIHTGIRPFKCPFDGCACAFISSGDLHKHVRRHNQEINPIPKPHICDKCGKDFERGYDLKRHSSMHAKDDPNFQGFNCELCGKMFARKDQYRAHTYRHIGYKPHKCDHCDKTFSDASNYAKHVKVHVMDGMQLVCHHCEKPFKNKMAISKHVFRCKYKSAKLCEFGSRKSKQTIIKKEEPEVTLELPEVALESPEVTLESPAQLKPETQPQHDLSNLPKANAEYSET